MTCGELRLDVTARRVTRNGTTYKLTPKATDLLKTFMLNGGQVLTRRFLMKEVWNTDYTDDTRTLEVHVSWLRKVIEDTPHEPDCLRTVRGVGYRFDPEKQ